MEDFSINMEAKHCAKNLELSEKIEHLARNPAFITLKHHKENLNSILPCHLINPSNKQTKTRQNQSNNGTTSKPKSMEKLNKSYKMVHCI